ncbi:hypothetical protein TSAR_016435 [Trichomalopsis sarcophagae]|uniref:Uncharacterized protein n=1 Tax=Trichomalopsis sarcophagae TaxID=543379 RepID=A0A232EGE5_9HYME|nr:hypothetical protein TSAR_016435 [Trichomalopsis sarcophagae]
MEENKLQETVTKVLATNELSSSSKVPTDGILKDRAAVIKTANTGVSSQEGLRGPPQWQIPMLPRELKIARKLASGAKLRTGGRSWEVSGWDPCGRDQKTTPQRCSKKGPLRTLQTATAERWLLTWTTTEGGHPSGQRSTQIFHCKDQKDKEWLLNHEQTRPFLTKRFKNCPPVTNIQMGHGFIPENNETLKVMHYSNANEPRNRVIYDIGESHSSTP